MTTTIAARVSEGMEREISYLAKEQHTAKSTVVRELLTFAVRKRLMQHALDKFSGHEISLGKAAELAKVSVADFMQMAAERKIPLHYSVESLRKDIAAL